MKFTLCLLVVLFGVAFAFPANEMRKRPRPGEKELLEDLRELLSESEGDDEPRRRPPPSDEDSGEKQKQGDGDGSQKGRPRGGKGRQDKREESEGDDQPRRRPPPSDEDSGEKQKQGDGDGSRRGPRRDREGDKKENGERMKRPRKDEEERALLEELRDVMMEKGDNPKGGRGGGDRRQRPAKNGGQDREDRGVEDGERSRRPAGQGRGPQKEEDGEARVPRWRKMFSDLF